MAAWEPALGSRVRLHCSNQMYHGMTGTVIDIKMPPDESSDDYDEWDEPEFTIQIDNDLVVRFILPRSVVTALFDDLESVEITDSEIAP